MAQKKMLDFDVTEEEIINVIKSMPKNKTSGPDGFTSEFFLLAWDVDGNQMVNAIFEFFSSGNLLKEINGTLITLLPKCP